VVNLKGPAREADFTQLGQDLTQALTRLGFGAAFPPPELPPETPSTRAGEGLPEAK
jgi:hypothetical protein